MLPSVKENHATTIKLYPVNPISSGKQTHRLRSLPLPWNNKRPSSKHELSQRSGPVLLQSSRYGSINSRGSELAMLSCTRSNAYLDATRWQLEQALHGLPPEALHPLGVQQLPHPVLREPNHGGRKHSAQRTEPSNPSAGLRKSTGENGEDLEEVDDVGLEQRAVAAEEGGEGLHPLAGPRRRRSPESPPLRRGGGRN